MKTNKCNSTHKQNQEQKSHERFNRCRKKSPLAKFNNKSHKNPKKVGLEETYINIIKVVYDSQHYASGKKAEAFSLK